MKLNNLGTGIKYHENEIMLHLSKNQRKKLAYENMPEILMLDIWSISSLIFGTEYQIKCYWI